MSRLSVRTIFPMLTLVVGASVATGDAPQNTQPAAAAALTPPGLSSDQTVWPNTASYRNSDEWLWKNHDTIRLMRPRVLVLNFANDVDPVGIKDRTERTIQALAESTRYHGFKDPAAPAFLQYEVVKYVDMRDDPIAPAQAKRNSKLAPYKPKPQEGQVCDYEAFYSEAFAAKYGFPDPRQPGRYLKLHELIQAGFVHELWFYWVHDDRGAPLETIEDKQYYDEDCRPITGKHGPAGNGHDESMPWSGRSFRITFFNPHRGIGCGMENFGHALEGMANYKAIAYYRKYFNEFADFDLDHRYKLPFNSLYALGAPGSKAEYLARDVLEVTLNGKTHRIEPYLAHGGSVHFPPGARNHYDKESPFTVASVIENWRLRNGPDGKDLVTDFNKDRFLRHEQLAPDCMGSWMVFWRQCMPGLDNACIDDQGRPMKNWWVFLFY
jgi:hypothetical protein